MMKNAVVVLGTLVLSAQGWTHHSFADYDRSVVRELEGELVDVRWRNPHVVFTVRVAEPDGGTMDWELETGAFYLLERRGLEEAMFPLNEQVRVAGSASATRAGRMQVSNMLLPTGEEVVFGGGGSPRWAGAAVAGEWNSEIVDRRHLGLFRVWSLANLGTYGGANRAMGEQLAAATRVEPPPAPDLDPCLPMGMPAAMISPLPVEFVDRGDSVELRLTGFGNVRNIVLSGEVAGDAVPLSDLGYSTGQWVGQTLEVQTTRVGWPYVDDAGTLQSENVEITEEFALLDDGNRLRYTQTITDPESFTEPLTVSWDWIDIGEENLNPVTCE